MSFREIKELLLKYDLKPKKKFGQNFLIDEKVIDKIVTKASDKDLLNIEIGPGLGSLTKKLVLNNKFVEAYEIDSDLANVLDKELNYTNLKIFNEDFLNCDLNKYNETLNITGNLPYYVTSKIIEKLILADLRVNKMTLMLQKEAAERLKKELAPLNLLLNYAYDFSNVMDVSRNCFYPIPNVDSRVICLTDKNNLNNKKALFVLMNKCFMNKRKTLVNNLKLFLSNKEINSILIKLGLKDNIRPEELSVDDYLKMLEVLDETKSICQD